MVSEISGSQSPVTALVVDEDPMARQRICKVLTKKGIEVTACASLSQGRQIFNAQPIVLARSPGDGSELNGFVDWVRLRSGDRQPYIVAIDDGEPDADEMESAAANPGCNAVMHAPVKEKDIEERLKAIDQWMAKRYSTAGEETADDAAASPPGATAAVLSAASVPEPAPKGQVVYSNVLVENAPLAMAMFDDQMRYLVANRKWHKEFHLQNVSLAGRSHYDVFPDLPDGWRNLFERCLKEGRGERCQEDLFERPDGTTDWVRWEVRPWRRAEGSVGGLIITSEVITDLRLREQRGRFEREFAGSVMNFGAAPVMLVDFSGRILRTNRVCEALFPPARFEKGEPHYWEMICEPGELEKEKEAFLKAVESLRESGRLELPPSGVYRIPGKNGAVRRFAWTNVPHVNDNGLVEAIIKIGLELGPEEVELPPLSTKARPVPVGGLTSEEWKQKEQALLDERNLYAQIAANAPFGIILIDREGHLVYSNPQHKAVLGYDVRKAKDVEHWLRLGCPDEEYAAEVIEAWRENVWRKQLPKTFTLATEEGLLKEIRFHPRLLADGKLLVSFSDVTEHHRTEEAFRASEAKFRALFHGSRVGMALIDKTGDFFDINAALETMLGYPRWEIRSKSLADCVYPADLPAVEALESAAKSNDGAVNEAEARFVRKDGSLLWVRLNASPIKEHGGDALFTAYTISDISVQRKAGKELRNSREQNRALLAAIPDLIMLLDENAKVTDMIPSTNRILALDPDRVTREGFASELPELAGRLHELVLEAHDMDGGVVRFEFSISGENDERRLLEARLVSCGNRHTLVMVGDVTDRQLAQEALMRQALAFENIDNAIVLTDLKGRITDFNPAAERLFGYLKSEIVGDPLYMLYEPDNPREFNQRISEEINANHRWSGRIRFHHKDGTEGECEVLYVPVESKGGGSRALVGINRPVVDEPEAPADRAAGRSEEKDRKGASGKAAAAAASSSPPVTESEAMHRLHHRVRNDLQIVSSLLNLQLASLPNQVGRMMLKENQNRILAISFIYGLLSKTEDQKTIRFADFMESLIHHLRKTFSVDDGAVGVALHIGEVELDVERAVPLGLIANELVSNAFQHAFPGARRGAVTVSLERTNGNAIFKISDNGIGLPMTFDLEDPPTLGLQIVKILVEQLRGSIELADSPETEVHVQFPVGEG